MSAQASIQVREARFDVYIENTFLILHKTLGWKT